jgi:hypothetical protein
MRSLNDLVVTAYMADVSTAGQIYIPAPDTGEIVEVSTALNGAIATSDAVLTVKTPRETAGTLTITQSGSAAGDVDTVRFNRVGIAKGEAIEIETNGASTNTVSLQVYVVIRR